MPQSTSNGDKIVSVSVPMTPLNLYLRRVASVTNGLRAQSAGYEYLPFQLGGLSGQLQALEQNVILSVIDFQVSGNT